MLQGKSALITGSLGGIGFEIAAALAKPLARGQPLHLLAEVGEWELFTNH